MSQLSTYIPFPKLWASCGSVIKTRHRKRERSQRSQIRKVVLQIFLRSDFMRVCIYEDTRTQILKLLWQNCVKFISFLITLLCIVLLNNHKLSSNFLLCLIYGRHAKFCRAILNYTKHNVTSRHVMFAVRTYYDEVVLSSDLCGLPRPLLRISDDRMIFSHQSCTKKKT